LLIANCTQRLGCGVIAPPDKPTVIRQKLNLVINDRHYLQNSARIAARYDGYDPNEQMQMIVDRFEEILSSPSAIL
jgi:UDP:flavonoid glycosyltransferase YjiC (YdhE family)